MQRHERHAEVMRDAREKRKWQRRSACTCAFVFIALFVCCGLIYRYYNRAPAATTRNKAPTATKIAPVDIAVGLSRLESKLDTKMHHLTAQVQALLRTIPGAEKAAEAASAEAGERTAAVSPISELFVDSTADCSHLWKWDDPGQWSGTYDDGLEWSGTRSPRASEGINQRDKVISLKVLTAKHMPRNDMSTTGQTPDQTKVHQRSEQLTKDFHKQECASEGTKMLFVYDRFDAASRNPWHRLTGVHSIWFALKAALWRTGYSNDVLQTVTAIDIWFTHPQEAAEQVRNMADRKQWAQDSGYAAAISGVFGKEMALLTTEILRGRPTDLCEYRNVIFAPDDGLLWDLAWDRKQGCMGAHPTWPLFVHDLRHGFGLRSFGSSGEDEDLPHPDENKQSTQQLDVHVCWASREGTTHAGARATDETAAQEWIESTCHGEKPVKFIKLAFDSMDPMAFQAEHLEECDVLVGVHGAGMLNHMFMEPGSAVVELLPEAAAYYRNTAHFSDQIYFGRHICKTDRPDCVGTIQGSMTTLKEQVFREVLMAAIASISHKGRRHNDLRVMKCGR